MRFFSESLQKLAEDRYLQLRQHLPLHTWNSATKQRIHLQPVRPACRLDSCLFLPASNQTLSVSVCASRTTERPTGDLRERMKNKRQDVDPENLKRDLDEPTSPTVRVSSAAECFSSSSDSFFGDWNRKMLF